MNTYVISDIHGCFDEFQQMLDQIGFSDSDRLILAGDYIDRGPNSLEMLRWLERRPGNVVAIRGNHDEEFADCIDLMRQTDRTERLHTEPDSNTDSAILYDTTRYLLKRKHPLEAPYFDHYGTVGRLLADAGATLTRLSAWADMVRAMPFFVKFPVAEKPCVVVHAGYGEGIFHSEAEAAEFYLYARAEECLRGGIGHGMVIAGHTPTVFKGAFYTNGQIFRYYDGAKDCIFYHIDCGCAYRQNYPDGRLACIRAEDERCYYV